MESRLYSLSTAVAAIGTLGSIAFIIAGFALSSVSGYLLLIAIIIGVLSFISTNE